MSLVTSIVVGSVPALLMLPEKPSWLYVMAHGAGAGMRHPFMDRLVEALAARDIATLRYEFPYMARGLRRPDRQPVLLATVRAAVTAAAALDRGLPLLAGGKSMGGRMTSLAAASGMLPGVCGLVFLGFPLHAAGSPPSVDRGRHLLEVGLPLLFVQGGRDRLADLGLLRGLVAPLGTAAQVEVLEGADHGFGVPRTAGLDQAGVSHWIASRVAGWAVGLQLAATH